MTEDEMVGWHDRLNGHELEQAPGIGDGIQQSHRPPPPSLPALNISQHQGLFQ